MRGFALSDSLMALAIVSLLLVVMLSRGPDLEAREAERRIEAQMFDNANAALVLSQTLDQTGSWVLFDRGQAVALPSDRFRYLNQIIALFPDAPYRLELHVIAVSADRYTSTVQLYRDDELMFDEEITWSSKQAS